MVTSQVLISCRQHSKDKCALNEKYIFLYAESEDFFYHGIASYAEVELFLKAHVVTWAGSPSGKLNRLPSFWRAQYKTKLITLVSDHLSISSAAKENEG